MSSSARFLWLSALTASLGASVEAATLACYLPQRHTLAFVECFSSGEGGTECDGQRFDLVDGGVSRAPWPTETKDGGEVAPFWSSAVLRQLQDSLDEGRGLSADGPGCLPVRRVDLSRAMTVRVIPHVLTPTESEVQEAQGGLGSFSGHWPDREVALSLAGKRVAQLELKDLKVDGVKVIGFDVGDHRHLLLLVSWGGFGFEGSVGYRARQVLVNVDASKLKTATDGAFRASAGLDVQAEEAAFAKVMAAALEKAKAPAAAEWSRYAREQAFRLQLRAAPAFLAAKVALDLVSAEAPEDDPSVLRAVFSVRQCLLPLSKEQRSLAAEPFMRSVSERQAQLLVAVFRDCDQPTWTVRVVRDGGVEEETLTFTPTGFRRRDGTTVKLPQPSSVPIHRSQALE
ncbi:MAG: hypothetical protein JNM69_37560 [Archangium sp.]|nr:hypothetical protein [Archangium sp.]